MQINKKNKIKDFRVMLKKKKKRSSMLGLWSLWAFFGGADVEILFCLDVHVQVHF